MTTAALSRHAVVAVAFLALGLYLAPSARGRHAARPADPAAVARPSSPAPRAMVAPSSLDAEVVGRAVRAAVREELAELHGGAGDRSVADAPDLPEASEPTTAQQDAAGHASAAVDRILGRGTLALDDTLALRIELAGLRASDAEPLRLRLVQAVNRDQLRATGPMLLP